MKKLPSNPFEFVMELLQSVQPRMRPMFGCHAIYVGEKIVLILRDKPAHPKDNGVWVSTTKAHHATLKKEFPSLRKIELFGSPETQWQNLPASSANFEEDVTRIVELILKGDERIGHVPGTKNRKIDPAETKQATQTKKAKSKSKVTWTELKNY